MSISEWLDMVWLTILDRGNHGLADAAKYRKTVTDYIWHGMVPTDTGSKTPPKGSKKSGAKKTPAPRSSGSAPSATMEQARALHAQLRGGGGQSD